MTSGFAFDMTFGANLITPDRARFRLFAPAQRQVKLEVAGTAPVPMQHTGDGWFEAERSCREGARYRYVLDDGSRVPDPAARTQARDVHGWSVVVDPKRYVWQSVEWSGRPWHEAIFYELHCGLLGGFSGVKSALPRLATLGITAIELMPINSFSGNRNWGYDGVLPFAPDLSYGSVDELKALIDAAHALGLMIFLDVVYNHFGPDGNYIARYAPKMFRVDFQTPWGAGIDFRLPAVRRFFTENALYWLLEYNFDGLRLDAVHAISEPDWLDEMAAEVRAAAGRERHVHLVLENERNAASHLRGGFDAQWNDDLHNVVHVLLTGESESYYSDFSESPTAKLAKGLAEGFIYQGEPSPHHRGAARGTPSADLPPTSFVFFLQNHDQIGNRAFGERLTAICAPEALEAAIALQLLAPQIPLLFMGEEDASQTPFLFFTDYDGELAEVVREGRRREFARFAGFSDPARRSEISDPNAPLTFERSIPQADKFRGAERFAFYQRLLSVRRSFIVPRLAGTKIRSAEILGEAAVCVQWQLGDRSQLTLLANLGSAEVPAVKPEGRTIFESRAKAEDALTAGLLQGQTTVAVLGAAL